MTNIVLTSATIGFVIKILDLFHIDYKVDQSTIIFNKHDVVKLSDYNPEFDYNKAREMWNNLSIIILFLERLNITVSHIDVDSVYVIDNLFYIPTNHFYTIANNSITIGEIFNKQSEYLSYDLINITQLPSEISYKSCYNSLAKVIIKYLFFINKPLTDNLREKISPIYATKLYWLLYWALDNDPMNRLILQI